MLHRLSGALLVEPMFALRIQVIELLLRWIAVVWSIPACPDGQRGAVGGDRWIIQHGETLGTGSLKIASASIRSARGRADSPDNLSLRGVSSVDRSPEDVCSSQVDKLSYLWGGNGLDRPMDGWCLA